MHSEEKNAKKSLCTSSPVKRWIKQVVHCLHECDYRSLKSVPLLRFSGPSLSHLQWPIKYYVINLLISDFSEYGRVKDWLELSKGTNSSSIYFFLGLGGGGGLGVILSLLTSLGNVSGVASCSLSVSSAAYFCYQG